MNNIDETIARLNRLRFTLSAESARPGLDRGQQLTLVAACERIDEAIRVARTDRRAAPKALIKITAEMFGITKLYLETNQ